VSGQRWTLIVPLKPASEGKSRLAGWLDPGPRLALVRAMVGDTVAAAAAARCVDRIVIVTGDAAMARTARRAAAGSLAIEVVDEPEPGGLNPAVRAGIDRARVLQPVDGVAVLLGDLPALRPTDVEDALRLAALQPRGVVTDAYGTGTTLLTAMPGVALDPAFGAGSAQLHVARGHVLLPLAPGSGLGCDVDVPADLDAVLALGVGPRTRRALRGVAAPQPGGARGRRPQRAE